MEPGRRGKGRVQVKVAAVAGKAARQVDSAAEKAREKAGARAGAVDRARVRVLEEEGETVKRKGYSQGRPRTVNEARPRSDRPRKFFYLR